VWKRTVGALTLTFHLAGINNQNFLMRDEQTGTFWQQISGRAISGPLAGSQLELVYSDELSFALWRKLAPGGAVLLPVARYSSEYETHDWDTRMAKQRTVLDFPKTPLKARDLVLGVALSGDSRAYEVNRVLHEMLIQDRMGADSLLLVVGPDSKSIRVFRAHLDGVETPEFFRKTDSSSNDVKAPLMIDSQTGGEWNFDGCAVRGKYLGRCLERVPAVKDYWFDWRNYHPDTTIFRH
jgi:Protein of unknown function (DUF3179)